MLIEAETIRCTLGPSMSLSTRTPLRRVFWPMPLFTVMFFMSAALRPVDGKNMTGSGRARPGGIYLIGAQLYEPY